MKPSSDSIFLGGAVVIVAVAVVAGMLVIGSPTEERSLRLDERRVADLQDIMAATNLYWTRHGELPASLDELSAEPGTQIRTRDPVSAEIYSYQPADSAAYELCGTFDGESRDIARRPQGDLWVHGPGRHCFDFEAREIGRRDR